MTETEFEQLVRRALLDANRADWAPVMDGAGASEPEFSPRYRRRRLRLVNEPFSYAKKAARPVWKRIARTAACILLAFVLSFGALMTVSPTVRAWVQELFIQWKNDHTSFQFEQKSGPVSVEDLYLDAWLPTWLPEGASLVEAKKLYGQNAVTYVEADGTKFFLNYMPATSNGAIGVDNEHQDYSQTVVNGNEAYLMMANQEGYMSFLIWVDEKTNLAFCITSELSGEEMIKMAESMEKVK